MIAIRSSATASVSRNVRSAAGRCEPITARTASAKAMSVAAGMAQPVRAAGSPRVHSDVDQRGDGHPADGCDHRHQGRLRVAEVTGDELALELEADEEEEHRQQPVSGPVADRQVEVQPEDVPAEMGVAQAEVEVRREVGRQHRRSGGDEQQDAADRLRPQDLLDADELAVRPSCEGDRYRPVAHQIFTRSPGGSQASSSAVTPKAS